MNIESLERRELLANWYAAVNGLPNNEGTIDSPWDLQTALTNQTDVGGGDTVYLRGGTYRHPDRSPGTRGYVVRLQGDSGAPVTVRPYQSERVTIDGGIHTEGFDTDRPEHLIIRDLEVIVSENLTQSRVSTHSGSGAPPDLQRPWGGIEIARGYNVKLVNNVIHANMQGVGFWQRVGGDSEVYGNLIFDNGWMAPDRGHGHGIYTQNEPTTHKYLRNNIMFGQYGMNVHAYGSESALTDNFVLAKNIFGGGNGDLTNRVLVGGLNWDSNTGFEIIDNVLHHSNLQVGYAGRKAKGAEVTGNRIAPAKAALSLATNSVVSDNFVWEEQWLDGWTGELRPEPNDGAPIPDGPFVFLYPNVYDPDRAHLAIMNFFEQATVTVDFTGFLNSGDTFRLMDPENFYGASVYTGVYEGKPIDLPLQNDDFGAFVVLRDAAAPSPTFAVTAASAVKAEGNRGTTSLSFTVTRSGDTNHPAAVDVAVSGTGANPVNAADFDRYVVLSRRLSFAPSETSWTFVIPAAGDLQEEADETFAVTLSNPSGGAQLATATALGTILNDDAAPDGQPSLVGTAQQANVLITAISMTDGNLYKTTTDQQGNYTLAVPAGTYSATAYHPSMTVPVAATNLTIASSPVKVDFDLARPTLTAADLIDRTDTTQWWVDQLASGASMTDLWAIWAASVTLWEVETLDFANRLTDVADRGSNQG